jgi:hypothetical protein
MPEQHTTPAGGQQGQTGGSQDSATLKKLREEVKRVNEINKRNRLSKGGRTGGGSR